METNTYYTDDNGGNNLLLCVMEVVTRCEVVEYWLNALIDSGSERFYLADSLQDALNYRVDSLPIQNLRRKFSWGLLRSV